MLLGIDSQCASKVSKVQTVYQSIDSDQAEIAQILTSFFGEGICPTNLDVCAMYAILNTLSGHMSDRKKGPNRSLRIYEGMGNYPVLWGLLVNHSKDPVIKQPLFHGK